MLFEFAAYLVPTAAALAMHRTSKYVLYPNSLPDSLKSFTSSVRSFCSIFSSRFLRFFRSLPCCDRRARTLLYVSDMTYTASLMTFTLSLSLISLSLTLSLSQRQKTTRFPIDDQRMLAISRC